MSDLSDSDITQLFQEYQRTRDVALRNRLVELHMDIADHLVRKYKGRSVAEDDLRQIGLLAIVHAVDRFDPDRGFAFSTFANRTVEGEIKHYFRDRTWSVRPPRRTQELYLEVRRAEEKLTHSLGRSPRVSELARHLDMSQEDVLEGLEAASAYRSTSLDRPASDDESGDAPLTDHQLGEDDPGFDRAEVGVWLTDLLTGLPERERAILEMRFVRGMTQPEIAAEIGVSQSYLSRVLRKTLSQLREQASTDPPPSTHA